MSWWPPRPPKTLDVEYGAFLLAEFLTERFDTAQPPRFLGASATVDPNNALVRRTWERAGEGASVAETLDQIAAENGIALTDFLNQFAKASYLLDDPSSPPLGGTYRDTDAPVWRLHLGLSTDHVSTHGDPRPTSPDFISSQPRAARQVGTVARSPLASRLGTSVGSGGSAYFEYKIPPDHTGSYAVTVDLAVFNADLDPSAMIMAFKSYPERCTADRVLSFGDPTIDWLTKRYHASAAFLLPEACTSITVVVTHGNAYGDTTADVTVSASMAEPFDSFERQLGQWGAPSSSSTSWTSESGSPVAGYVGIVEPGTAWLSDGGTAMHGDPTRPLESVTMIGRLRACTDPNASFTLETQFPAGLATTLRLAANSSVTLDTGSYFDLEWLTQFDPCKPWYLKVAPVGDHVASKVWQVTAPEPVDWTLDQPSESGVVGMGGRLVLRADGASVSLDVLDVTWMPTS